MFKFPAPGCNPTETEVNTLMASIDVDHNGKIDLLEFVLMMHNTVGKTDTMEEIRMAFRFASRKFPIVTHFI